MLDIERIIVCTLHQKAEPPLSSRRLEGLLEKAAVWRVNIIHSVADSLLLLILQVYLLPINLHKS